MLVFTHIPRTGGTTLRAIIAKHKESHIYIDSFSNFSFMNDEELNSHTFIATHCGYGIFNRINKPHKKLVILRDPIERIVSHYYYLKGLEDDVSYASYYAKTQSLKQFVETENPATQIGIDNAQTWHLIKDKNSYVRNSYKGMSDDKLLEMAIDHLSQYDFVGFTDSLPSILSKIESEYGWAAISQDLPFLRKSEKPNTLDISENILSSVRDRVGLDLLLYSRAKQMVLNKDGSSSVEI